MGGNCANLEIVNIDTITLFLIKILASVIGLMRDYNWSVGAVFLWGNMKR